MPVQLLGACKYKLNDVHYLECEKKIFFIFFFGGGGLPWLGRMPDRYQLVQFIGGMRCIREYISHDPSPISC